MLARSWANADACGAAYLAKQRPSNRPQRGKYGTLDIVFDEINVEVVGTTLQVSGSTSAANNYTIYFEVEEGETGDDIINAEFVIFFTSEFFPYFDGIEPFRSNISANPDGSLTGTFCCNTRNADNGDLNLTSGMINITY